MDQQADSQMVPNGYTQSCYPSQNAHPGSQTQRPQNSLKEKLLWMVCLSWLWDLTDLSHLGSRRSVTPFMQLDGQSAQEDPTSRSHGC